MGQKNHAATFRADVADRGDDLLNPCRIGDAAIFHRHVDVDTGQHRFARKIEIIQGVPRHLRPPIFGKYSHPCARLFQRKGQFFGKEKGAVFRAFLSLDQFSHRHGRIGHAV